MTGIAFLIPIALLMGGAGLAAFFWAMRSGQYEDMDGAASGDETLVVEKDKDIEKQESFTDELDKFMTDALQGACKAYNIALGSTCAGDFKTHERPASSSSKASGFIRRSIGKLLGPGSDWCLDLGDNTERIADHRPLLASMVLLLEQTVRSDQSS